MSQWQKIDTAPMDGTRVLLYRSGWMEGFAVGWANGDEWDVACGHIFSQPTHWMPLPDPPQEA